MGADEKEKAKADKKVKADEKEKAKADKKVKADKKEKAKPAPNKEVQAMINAADKNGDALIDFDEFENIFANADTFKEAMRKEMRPTFDRLDKDHNGELSVKELKKALKALGKKGHDVKDLINHADANGNGIIDFEEFKTIFMPEEK